VRCALEWLFGLSDWMLQAPVALPRTRECVFAERFVNDGKELPPSHGFGQNGHGSRCHSPTAHEIVKVGGNEDDGSPDAARGQFELQLQPSDSRHAHIQDQTPRAIEIVPLQEVINRSEGSSGKTVRLQ